MAQASVLVRQSFDALSHLPDVSSDPVSEQLARRTLEFAQLRVGEQVLDVATGVGLVLVPAARAVYPGGSVQGLDISQGMVEQARRNVAAAGLTNASVAVGDVEAASFPAGRFDVVTASAALPYMADAAAALARWRGWLRAPSGRLVLNCFTSPYDPECGLFYRLAAKHGLAHMFADPLAQCGSREGLTQMLRRAGFKGLQAFREEFLREAERSAAERLRDGSVHNSVGVLYGVAHAV
ncbi:hypothetical protein GPECTOR_5g226 [Gonium pectorale]|uniref:Methyltransferase domain-containing protein n=1 Tax=Gonium pectorale TaxID=33097 RepID=A0A150GWF5_GONPE|nr:hypothetical protein GPECTOR_5g226 [Gonium pectorale]|eukprot:KXZ54125.1 hypothetical protein GPECTOR_5g226 [Gonium pectorale]